MRTLANLGALSTLFLGLLGLIHPLVAAKLVGIIPESKLGLSEIRATYGGLFIALAVVCLIMQSPAVFLTAVTAWLGAACARIVSVLIDQSYSVKNVGGMVLEPIIRPLRHQNASILC